MFSRNTAVEFVKTNLCLDYDLQNLNLELLNKIIQAFYENIPFNNFSLIASEVQERACPTLEQMYFQIQAGSGGLCNALNTVFKHLLDALGYRTDFGRGRIVQSKSEESRHMMVLVHDVQQEGDIYYTDVGIGFPTFEAIPLNDLPRTYKFAFHSSKFENGADGKIVRFHRKNAVIGAMADGSSEVWEPFLAFDKEPRTFSDFHVAMTEVYTSPKQSIFLNIVYAAFYPSGNAVTLKDLTMRTWNKQTQLVDVTVFETVQEAFEVVANAFYTVDKNLIKRALENWSNRRENDVDA